MQDALIYSLMMVWVYTLHLFHVYLSGYYEPRREKTGLRGFRPGPTQTGLYKLRKELEA